MASNLQWETLQRNYLRHSLNYRDGNVYPFTNENLFSSEDIPAKPRTRGDSEGQQGEIYDYNVSTSPSQSPDMIKTKISRAPVGNYYAVFRNERDTVNPTVGDNQGRSDMPAFSNSQKDFDLPSGSKLDYKCNQAVGRVAASTNVEKSAQEKLPSTNFARHRSCRVVREPRHDIMDQKEYCMDNSDLNWKNNGDLAQRPGRRQQQSRNSLNFSSVRVRSRRQLVQSEGNLEEKVTKSSSFGDGAELLNRINCIEQDPTVGELGNGNQHFRQHSAFHRGSKHGNDSDMDAYQTQNKGLKPKQDLTHQSSHFGKMLKQFKDKENERERLLEKRRLGEISKPSTRPTQDIVQKTEEKSHPKLTRILSDQSNTSSKDEENDRPRFSRRKISYMDSWLQSQQSRITNLVETVKGESADVGERGFFERAKTFDCGEPDFSTRYSQRLKNRDSFRQNSVFESDDNAFNRRAKFKHLKSASLDIARSRDSDTDSEIPPSECSDTTSLKSLSITSDTEAAGSNLHINSRNRPIIGQTGNLESNIRPDMDQEPLSSNEGGAVIEGCGETVNFSSYNMPLVQKYVKQGHPLAVVKPFHLGSESTTKTGDQVVKTNGETTELIPTTPTSPLLETDLDSVMENLEYNHVMESTTEADDDYSSRRGSITRVAIVTIQRKHVGGILEKKTLHRGIGGSSQTHTSEDAFSEKEQNKRNLYPDRSDVIQGCDTNKNYHLGGEETDENTERLGKSRFLNLRSQFDQSSSGNFCKPDFENRMPRYKEQNLNTSTVSKSSESSIDHPSTSETLDSSISSDLETTICENKNFSVQNTGNTESESELNDLNNERLGYLNEALKPDEEEVQFETRSICSTDIPVPAERISPKEITQDNRIVAVNELGNESVGGSTDVSYVHFRSKSADVIRDMDRASLASYRYRSGSAIGEDIQEFRQSHGYSYPGSVRESASEDESSDDEEKLKTMSERIRPWNPAASEAACSSSSSNDKTEQEVRTPRTLKRQGKGAVDRINKSLSVVMGELKELRKQDIDLAKQLLTLGKSIKEFKKHKREMEEEMLADYLFDLESADQFSIDDGFSLNSYDVDYLQK